MALDPLHLIAAGCALNAHGGYRRVARVEVDGHSMPRTRAQREHQKLQQRRPVGTMKMPKWIERTFDKFQAAEGALAKAPFGEAVVRMLHSDPENVTTTYPVLLTMNDGKVLDLEVRVLRVRATEVLQQLSFYTGIVGSFTPWVGWAAFASLALGEGLAALVLRRRDPSLSLALAKTAGKLGAEAAVSAIPVPMLGEFVTVPALAIDRANLNHLHGAPTVAEIVKLAPGG